MNHDYFLGFSINLFSKTNTPHFCWSCSPLSIHFVCYTCTARPFKIFPVTRTTLPFLPLWTHFIVRTVQSAIFSRFFVSLLCCFFVAFLVLLLYFSSQPPLCIWIVRYSRLFVLHLLPLANRFRYIYSNNNNIWNKPIFIDVMQMVVAFQTKSSGKKASFKHLFGSCINLLPARIERV